jgi:hypothetical protein
MRSFVISLLLLFIDHQLSVALLDATLADQICHILSLLILKRTLIKFS